MDTLEGIRHLCNRAKDEPIRAFDVVESVRRDLGSLEIEAPEPPLTAWKVSAAAATLAAVVPLAAVARACLALDDVLIKFYLPAQEVWLW